MKMMKNHSKITFMFLSVLVICVNANTNNNLCMDNFRRECIQPICGQSGIPARSALFCGSICLTQSTCDGFIFDKVEKTCITVESGSYTTCSAHPAGTNRKSYIKVGQIVDCLFVYCYVRHKIQYTCTSWWQNIRIIEKSKWQKIKNTWSVCFFSDILSDDTFFRYLNLSHHT